MTDVIEKKIEKKSKKYKKFGHNEPHDVCSCGDHRRSKCSYPTRKENCKLQFPVTT